MPEYFAVGTDPTKTVASEHNSHLRTANQTQHSMVQIITRLTALDLQSSSHQIKGICYGLPYQSCGKLSSSASQPEHRQQGAVVHIPAIPPQISFAVTVGCFVSESFGTIGNSFKDSYTAKSRPTSETATE